jgi:hypothetical protein
LSSTPGQLEQRIRLAELLCEAAELEHGLLCQYLFAAFSFKRDPGEGVRLGQLEQMRTWEADVLLIARQEMEHLGLVCNLLTAIGEAPYLQRPNFPLASRHYPMHVRSQLERFGLDAVKRFLMFELPDSPTDEERELLERIEPGFDHDRYKTIGELYGEIAKLIEELAGTPLFIGPRSAELVDYGDARGVQVPGAGTYDIKLLSIDDQQSALEAIERIVIEGEGSAASHANSHFGRLCQIYEQLDSALAKDPTFDPARPATAEGHGHVDAAPRRLLNLFDLAYETLMLMLFRIFACTEDSGSEAVALQYVAFFPMMTTVIRPLGEVLTATPLRRGDAAANAGPRFLFTRPTALLPHRSSAWIVIHTRLELLAALSEQLAPRLDGVRRDRLELMAENLGVMARTFAAAMGIGQ